MATKTIVCTGGTFSQHRHCRIGEAFHFFPDTWEFGVSLGSQTTTGSQHSPYPSAFMHLPAKPKSTPSTDRSRGRPEGRQSCTPVRLQHRRQPGIQPLMAISRPPLTTRLRSLRMLLRCSTGSCRPLPQTSAIGQMVPCTAIISRNIDRTPAR
jgi:hypothetical protein